MTIAERASAAHAKLVADPVELAVGDPGPEMMFDDAVYKRGALALTALRAASGDEKFFTLLRQWAVDNRHGSVSTPRFIALADRLCADIPEFSATAILTPWLFRKQLPPLPQF
ncbi:hypothetical protein [Arthrobacter psychrolactophilus]